MTQLAGATVLVTGAARGLGRSMALQAAERGASLVLWDRDAPRLQDVVAELPPAAVVASGVVDVTDRAAVSDAAAALPGGADAVDVVVNNAGIVSGAPLLELTEEQIRRTFEVNVLGLFWVTQAFLPKMVARDSGHVVTIASAAGLVGVARQTDYSASKHAARGFGESLRAELRQARSSVRTTLVNPYFIDTGMFEGASTRWPWLLPVLHEPDVARSVLDAVEGDTADLVLPPLVATVSLARMLPTSVFDWLSDLLGVNQTMAGFVGRLPALRLAPQPDSASRP